MLAVYQQLRFVFLWLWHFHISGFGSTSMWEDVVVCIHNKGCCFVFQLEDEKFSAQEELKDVEEELQANREIVRLLQKELDVIRVSLETRFGCHHSSTRVYVCGYGGRICLFPCCCLQSTQHDFPFWGHGLEVCPLAPDPSLTAVSPSCVGVLQQSHPLAQLPHAAFDPWVLSMVQKSLFLVFKQPFSLHWGIN